MTVSFPGIEEAAFQAVTIKNYTRKIILCVDALEYQMESTEDGIPILEVDGIQVCYTDSSPYEDVISILEEDGIEISYADISP